MATVELTGLNSVLAKLSGIEEDINDAINEAVRVIAINTQNDAIESIREPSIGKTVTRYTDLGETYTHVASKEGDAPNTDTSGLINSIEMKHVKKDTEAFVFTNLKYGFFLETVFDRPFLQPALDNNRGFMLDTINSKIKETIGKTK